MVKKDDGKVDIHGKEYLTVALRVSMFREAHPERGLTTTIISMDEKCVVVKCEIYHEDGRLLATGHAEENRASSHINRTSALENCETSAIGRALAAMGYAGTEFASADEVANALKQQQEGRTARPAAKTADSPPKSRGPQTATQGDSGDQFPLARFLGPEGDVTGRVMKVTSAETSRGGTRYGVLIDQTGWFGTFSDTVADACKKAQAEQADLTIRYEAKTLDGGRTVYNIIELGGDDDLSAVDASEPINREEK